MADLIQFDPANPVLLGRKLRGKREEARLTLAQAATALGISPITLDGWEQGRKPQISADDAERAYDRFRRDTNNCRKAGNNLIFGVFPVRIARDILELSLEEMAQELGYSASSWSKMEANARIVPADKIAQIETRVSEAWNAACTLGSPGQGALP
ncbi:MAG TPA: helix-turn-helix domain-containing protein [Allosphingosinicella sp.]|jgi:transcriptional regulator with XRE-family HTH domain|nr:helix-turn-helix domain-containing protein [Allosphingosinicella sp.]